MYKWVSGKQEPLCSYATGLLGVVMELNEVATEPGIRDLNSKLVPEMLEKLKLQTKNEIRQEAIDSRDSSPFSQRAH